MMEVVWSSGFKRSFRKITKKNPQLKNQIVKVLRLLADDPFTPSLKSLEEEFRSQNDAPPRCANRSQNKSVGDSDPRLIEDHQIENLVGS
jgi:hypothetical protein